MSTLSAAKENERIFIIECIRLYRQLPALWNVKSKAYHDRDKKKMGYDLLLRKYKEMYPEATKVDIKKKINALRTNYRKELKKCVASVTSGGGTRAAVYEPTLWYFREINFLQDQEAASDSESSLDIEYKSAINVEDEDVDQNTGSKVRTSDDTDAVHAGAPHTVSMKLASKKTNDEENLVDLAYEHISDKNDEYSHWAMACAADIRRMDWTQQAYAKKAIAEILMEGQLGLLHRHSVKVNESPLHAHYSSFVDNPTEQNEKSLLQYISSYKDIKKIRLS